MTMTFTSPRATFEETLAFANAVREAGGGTTLDALMPAVPGDPHSCLIAANLNFNSCVDGADPKDGVDRWAITFSDREVADRVETALGLERASDYDREFAQYRFLLPPEIGRLAYDFDLAQDLMRRVDSHETLAVLDQYERQLVIEMEPYIEASKRECYEYGTVIDGKLVL